MPASTLTSKGQLTVPREVRERLGVSQGDRLTFRFDEQGRLFLEPEKGPPLHRLFGLLKHRAPTRPVSVEEMDASIGDYLSRKARAIRTKGHFDPDTDLR